MNQPAEFLDDEGNVVMTDVADVLYFSEDGTRIAEYVVALYEVHEVNGEKTSRIVGITTNPNVLDSWLDGEPLDHLNVFRVSQTDAPEDRQA